MKYIILSILMACSFTLLGGVTACSPDDTGPSVEGPAPPDNNEGNPDNPDQPGDTDHMKVEIKIGETTFTATLRNNATAIAFKEMLPLIINMSELNNNEKYYNFSGSLPTAATRPGTIRKGDIMLYGNNCLVLFYKAFTSSYSYTPIGTIDNPAGLDVALGTGSVIVTWNEMK